MANNFIIVIHRRQVKFLTGSPLTSALLSTSIKSGYSGAKYCAVGILFMEKT
jgi:hypothetical protein